MAHKLAVWTAVSPPIRESFEIGSNTRTCHWYAGQVKFMRGRIRKSQLAQDSNLSGDTNPRYLRHLRCNWMRGTWNWTTGVARVEPGIWLCGLDGGISSSGFELVTNHFRTPRNEATKIKIRAKRQAGQVTRRFGSGEQDPKTRDPPPPQVHTHAHRRETRISFFFFFGNDAQNQRVFQLAASVGEQLSRQSHVDFDFGFVSFRFGLVSSPENISQSV